VSSSPTHVKPSGCAKSIIRFIELFVLTVLALPIAFIVVVAWMTWKWYSITWAHSHDFDNALMAISGVGGVLWSGAVITYSIHQRYTPKLRTAVQLIQFAFLASLVGLIAQGATLRTAFYLLGCFYAISALFSFALRTLEPHLASALSSQMASAQAQGDGVALARQRARDGVIRYLKLISHGAWYFMFVAVVCVATVVLARQDIIAWSCLIVFVVSLFLILPELFEVVESKAQEPVTAGEHTDLAAGGAHSTTEADPAKDPGKP
jgi:hypothetical protein